MLLIERAILADAASILELQKLAYQEEAALYQDFAIPPLTQTLSQIQAEFDDHLFLKAVIEDHIVGSVRAHVDSETAYIGRLIVHPNFQNQGIGSRLLREIEQACAGLRRFELFTGYLSARNLYLYQKSGYQEFKREVLSPTLTLVFLEKNRA